MTSPSAPVGTGRLRSSCSSWSSLVVAACAARRPARPGASGALAGPRPPRIRRSSPPSRARTRSASWPGLFTPIFQAMFIILVGAYDLLRNLGVPAAIGWAIVVLTLVVRAVVIPLYRRQLVSQRRMQLLQPEIKEIQRRYKGDAMKARRRPAGAVQGARRQPARRLPAAPPPDAAAVHHVLGHPERADQPGSPRRCWTVFGVQVVPDLQCINVVDGVSRCRLGPCIDTVIPSLGNLDVSQPSTFFSHRRSAGSSSGSASWRSSRPACSWSSRG